MGHRARLRVTHLLILRSLTLNSMKNCSTVFSKRPENIFVLSFHELLYFWYVGLQKCIAFPAGHKDIELRVINVSIKTLHSNPTWKCMSEKYATFVTCACNPIVIMHFLTTRFAEFKTIDFKLHNLLFDLRFMFVCWLHNGSVENN